MMQELLKSWLKKISSDLHNIILSVIVFSFLSTGTASLVSAKIWSQVKEAILLPVPLWITIALALATYTCFHIMNIRSSSKSDYKTKYFTIGKYKWKVKVYNYGYFEIDKYPICKTHDLKFIFGTKEKYCPGPENETCKNRLSEYEEFNVYESAKSIIENKIRNKKC